MHITHRKRFISRDLVALAARSPQELAALSEQHYHDQIESIADEVLAAGQRIVMLTGPSAAGKTTSAHKIAGAIAARGHSSQVVSLDDFYIGEGKYPKNPDGSDDYESLESLDLEQLHFCLKELYKTGICEAPVFDFTLQQPSGTRRIDARGGVVIIEGLHALNPALTEELPAGAALCLYAGLREEYADSSDACCLATRDIRLARRIVRDYLFRGHGAAFTLGLWGHVCAGEERFIKPYKPRANLLLDTTHTYEVCLWRTVLDAMPADPELTPVQARQLEALRARFDAFPALGTELVPQNSLLREGLQLVDSAKKTAQDLADKGKNKLDLLNQQARLSKAQRQLGALVYSLHKAGEENPALVEKYIDAVAEVEKAIEEIKAGMTEDERAEVEAQEATDAAEDAPEQEQEEEIEEEPIQLRGETKICPVCKAEVDGDALFCNHCGAQL